MNKKAVITMKTADVVMYVQEMFSMLLFFKFTCLSSVVYFPIPITCVALIIA